MASCNKGQRNSFRNKYLALIISMLLFFSVNAQVTPITYTPMSAAGYQMKYLKTDSGFALPFRDTTIGRGVDRPGLMVINPVDSLPYYYNGAFWKPVYVDSTGVIKLINGKVDSVTVNGNNLFYWVAGLGYGQQLNKLDSIHVSADSVFTCIAGTCTFSYLTTAGTGTITQIISGFGLTGDTITSSGTIAVDTSVFHTSNFNDARYAPISHTHAASDIISGTFPIARGGTGLSGIGSVGQLLRVKSDGVSLEYFTPTYLTPTDSLNVALLNGGKIDTSHLPKQNFLFQYPLYAVNDTTAGIRTDSLPLLTYGAGVDTSLISGRKIPTADWVLARVGSGGGGSVSGLYQHVSATSEGQTVFTFTTIPTDANKYSITIWGVVVPKSQYTVDTVAKTITFTTGVQNGADVIIQGVQ